MKDELITFPTAQLVKKKGFDEEVSDYFKMGAISLGLQEDHLDKPQKITSFFPNQALWARPTQSLLQQWLRKKHKIHVAAHPELSIWRLEIKELNGEEGNPCFTGYPDLEYDTYETALEAGLLQALKLI